MNAAAETEQQEDKRLSKRAKKRLDKLTAADMNEVDKQIAIESLYKRQKLDDGDKKFYI